MSVNFFSFILAFLLTTITFSSFAQDQFSFSEKGLTPDYIVVEVDSLSQNELFNKTINWIKETYRDPDEVIKAKIENDKVRFEGSKENLICTKSFGISTCFNGLYTIEIAFKEGKFKFEPLSVKYDIPATVSSPYSVNGEVYLDKGSVYYRNNGKLRRTTREIPPAISKLFNQLSENLEDYVANNNIEEDDW